MAEKIIRTIGVLTSGNSCGSQDGIRKRTESKRHQERIPGPFE